MTSATAAAARSPSPWTPTTAPTCANCTPCSGSRAWSREWLSGRDCRRLEPMLAPGVRGGLRVDGDHQIDPRRLAGGAGGRVRAGGRGLPPRRGPSGFRRTGPGRRVSPWRDGDELGAGQVVLAAGSLSGRLAGVPDDVLPPVRPVKGQVLRLTVPQRYAPFLSRTVRAVVRGSQVYLVPRENGELVVGATSEELGWDTTVTAGGVYELLRDAHELVPGHHRAAADRDPRGPAPRLPRQRAAARPDRPGRAAAGHRPLPQRRAAHAGHRRRHGARPDHR